MGGRPRNDAKENRCDMAGPEGTGLTVFHLRGEFCPFVPWIHECPQVADFRGIHIEAMFNLVDV
jgi:hypothetical protein